MAFAYHNQIRPSALRPISPASLLASRRPLGDSSLPSRLSQKNEVRLSCKSGREGETRHWNTSPKMERSKWLGQTDRREPRSRREICKRHADCKIRTTEGGESWNLESPKPISVTMARAQNICTHGNSAQVKSVKILVVQEHFA